MDFLIIVAVALTLGFAAYTAITWHENGHDD